MKPAEWTSRNESDMLHLPQVPSASKHHTRQSTMEVPSFKQQVYRINVHSHLGIWEILHTPRKKSSKIPDLKTVLSWIYLRRVIRPICRSLCGFTEVDMGKENGSQNLVPITQRTISVLCTQIPNSPLNCAGNRWDESGPCPLLPPFQANSWSPKDEQPSQDCFHTSNS